MLKNFAFRTLLRSPDDPTATPTTTAPAPEPTPTQAPVTTEAPAFGADPITLDVLKAALPQEVEVDEAALTSFSELINKAGSREEFAREALGFYTKLQTEALEANTRAWQETQDRWIGEVKSDPNLGGEKLDASLATAKEVVMRYAGEDAAAVMELFDLTGVGNNVHIVRLLNNFAKALPGEAKPITGDPAPTDKTRSQKLFTAT